MNIWFYLGRLLAVGMPLALLATTLAVGFSLTHGYTPEETLGLGLTIMWSHVVIAILGFRFFGGSK